MCVYSVNRSVKAYWDNKEALGDAPDVTAYLCQRLQCSPHTVNVLMIKCPRLQTLSARKIKSKIDLLFQNGITSEQILSCPNILTFGCERIESRLDQLKNHNLPVSSLRLLYCNDEKMNKAIQRLLNNTREKWLSCIVWKYEFRIPYIQCAILLWYSDYLFYWRRNFWKYFWDQVPIPRDFISTPNTQVNGSQFSRTA